MEIRKENCYNKKVYRFEMEERMKENLSFRI